MIGRLPLSLYSTATPSHWAIPQTREFCVGYTNMLVSKNAKICIPPDAKPQICITPNAKPNATQWNIGCIGSLTHSQCSFADFCKYHLLVPQIRLERVQSRYYDRKVTLKPIFHCNAKILALGHRIGHYLKRESFALDIPTCWYLKMLKFSFPPTPNLKCALPPTPNPTRLSLI